MRVMEIKLYEILNTDTLRHRDTVRAILGKVSESKNAERIVIDFSQIAFASLAFCHEFRRGLGTREVAFANMIPEVEGMMNIAFSKPKVNFEPPVESKKLTERVSDEIDC